MIFFYNKSNNKIYSYVMYILVYDDEILLNKPSIKKCAQNNNVLESNIGVAEFLIENPYDSDFKADITGLVINNDYKVL